MLQAHQRLGDFEIIRFLGKGGMSEVYEAKQHNPERSVALKVLAPWLAEYPDSTQRFEREAAVLARLDHPGIVRILTTGRTEDGTFFYTMQLIRGASLQRLIRDGSQNAQPVTAVQQTKSETDTPAALEEKPTAEFQPQPPEVRSDVPATLLKRYREDRFGFVVEIGIQVAKALSAAHRAEVLHRDLKPSNLMLDPDGHVYLVDFGLVRLLDSSDGTQSRVVRGTPWYMSPEQARAEVLDVRSDLYSLGVTLYELTTGGVGPFRVERSDQDGILKAVGEGRILPLDSFRPDIPDNLRRVIEKAMAIDRERRYQSATEMLSALENRSTSAPADVPDRCATPTLSPPQSRRRFLKASLIAAPVVALGGWYGVDKYLSRGQPKSGPDPAENFCPFENGDPIPSELVERKFDRRVSLLTNNYEPIWPNCVFSKGEYASDRNCLTLHSKGKNEPFLLALYYDPLTRWYTFEVEMRTVVGMKPLYDQGLFFGYRRNREEKDRRYPFFVVQLKENRRGREIDGKIVIGSAYLEEARGLKAPVMQWYAPFPGNKGEINLASRTDQSWRRVSITARDHIVSIAVDQVPPLKLKVADLPVDFAGATGGGLDPRGAVGLWVDHGVGDFRNCWVTSLPSEAVGS